MTSNIILKTDSYKLTQYPMYPEGTEKVHSYFEARQGAEFDEVVFFGLQAIIMQHLTGRRVENIGGAEHIVNQHLGPGVFNRAGWDHIVKEFDGKIPVVIRAVPEGSVNALGDVLMTVENHGGEELAWLTSYLETLLVQVWYPMTVASLSRSIKKTMVKYLRITTGTSEGVEFMLHDFGCRGATSMESAAIGGAAHLVNFSGTDTVPALWLAKDLYGAEGVAGFSVPAAEHSVMTSLDVGGEMQMVGRLLKAYPTGILAAPIDSYNYINFPRRVARAYGDEIVHRDGKFVFRPDSCSDIHQTPEDEMVWLLNELWDLFGGTVNDYGFKVLDPHIGTLWGDGIDAVGIEKILAAAYDEGFAASNVVFGMGGGLLQKVNRDTLRCAFKCSAQKRNGEWHDVQKRPLDTTKASKTGRFKELDLPVVFDTGELITYYNFEQVRENAKL